jgi:uncharacterized membrane protein
VLSLVGLALLVWGYGLARQQPVVLWVPPLGMRHAASLLTLIAFVLLAATYVPRNVHQGEAAPPHGAGREGVGAGHLLANGNLADVLLFGGFLLWAVLSFKAARGRDRAAGTTTRPARLAGTAITVVVGLLAWAGFAFWAHGVLIGVRPFG